MPPVRTLLFCLLLVTPAAAQDPAIPAAEVQVQPLLQSLRVALADKRWLDATRVFETAWQQMHAVEDQVPDLQFEGTRLLRPGQHQFRAGARTQLRHIFHTAAAAFQQEYQRQYDVPARQQLQSALQRGDRGAVADLVRRHEFCDSSSAAVRWLLADAMARGDWLSAARQIRRLAARSDQPSPALDLLLAEVWLRCGFESESNEAVRRALQHAGAGSDVRLGTRTLRLPPSPAEVDGWLAGALGVAAGDSRLSSVLSSGQTSHLSAEAPVLHRLLPAWDTSTFATATHPRFNEQLQQLERRILALTGADPLPPLRPIITQDLVICQAAGTLRAVRRQTGELVWESSPFNHQLLAALQEATSAGRRQNLVSMVDLIFREAPRNHVRGQMTTDGRLLFCVEETTQGLSARFAGTAASLRDRHQNVLRVYDVATGRLRGQAGGSVGASDPLATMYFLGAPLLLDDRVLILAEDPQGIHLLDLRFRPRSPEPGAELRPEIADRQLLSIPLYELPVHPVRRLCGVTPRFSDGMIICHACDEQVTGLSATDLSIEWVHRYRATVRPKELGGGNPVVANATSDAESRRRDLRSRPHDSDARITASCVLLMPRDSDQLVCLDLHTGQEVWSRSRGELRYLAAVTETVAVLAGASIIEAVSLADGSDLWRQELSEAEISAQPAATGPLIYLPTRQGHLLVMETETGRRLLDLPLLDTAIGNLISVPGQLIAQSSTRLTSWQSADGDDSPLAVIEGLLLTSRPEEAVAELTEYVSTSSGSEQQAARHLLIEQLLEALRLDYEGHRGQIPLLKELIAGSALTSRQLAEVISASFGLTLNDSAVLTETWNSVQRTSQQKYRLDRLIVDGLTTQSGLTVDEVISQVSEILPAALEQPDRLVRGGRVRLRASARKAAAIQQALSQLREADQQHAVQQLRPVLRRILFGDADQPLQLEQLWFCWNAGLADCLLPLDDPVVDGRFDAVHPAMVTQLLASPLAGWQQAEETHEVLRARWNREQPPAVDRWPALSSLSSGPANDPLGRVADRLQRQQPVSADWNQRPVVTAGGAHSAVSKRQSASGAPESRIPIRGTPGVYRGWQLVRQVDSRTMVAIDADGQRRWEFDPSRNGHIQIRPNRSGRVVQDYAVACGRLLALTDSDRLFMLNAAEVRDGAPQELWSVDLNQLLAPPTGHQRYSRSWERTTMYDLQPDGLAPLGPLTEFGLPLLRGDQLIVLNPWNGSPIWSQDGLPDDTRLAADGADLCLISESTSQIQVRNLRDGSVRRTGRLPSWWSDGNALYDTSVRHVDLEPGEEFPWRIVVEGTTCLFFTLQPERARLVSWNLTDVQAAGPAVAWQTEFSADTVFSNVCDGLVATLSDGDRLQIRQVADGIVTCDQIVPAAGVCDRLYLRRSGNRLLVLTYAPHNGDGPIPVMGAVPLNGPIYAVDSADGSIAWTSQATDEYLRVLNANRMPTLPTAPLLVLLSRRTRSRPGNGIRATDYATRVLSVNDGQVLYEDARLGASLSYHGLRFDGDGRFTLNFDRRAIEFDFRPEAQRP